jgi:SAM-dependent methyltransferase
VRVAREAWAGRPRTEFHQADIFALPFEDRSFDVVLCCNVLLHLPSIARPLAELARVARRHVVVRTLVGERSFRIQDVQAATPPGEEFDAEGEPRRWHYYNIYSKAYVEARIAALPGVASVEIRPDTDFSPERIQEAAGASRAPDSTRMLGGWQVNGFILQPWHFIHAKMKPGR